MPRIRTLKPEYWQDEKMSALDPLTRLVFLGLISLADDQGRLVDNLKSLDGQLFPQTEDSARESLETLARIGRITRYRAPSGQNVIQIANWSKHQKVNHPGKAVLPSYDDSCVLRQEPGKRASREPQESLPPRPSDLVTERPSDLKASGAKRAEPKYPHFPAAICDRLHAVWSDALGEIDYSRFRRAFAPLFPAVPKYDPEEVERAIVACAASAKEEAIEGGRSVALNALTPETFASKHVRAWVEWVRMPNEINGVPTAKARKLLGVR